MAFPFIHPSSEPVSSGHATSVAVGDLEVGLRPARMEISDSHRLGGGADQLFLASGTRCQLGPRPFFREQHVVPGLVYLLGLFDCYAAAGLLANALVLRWWTSKRNSIPGYRLV